MARTAHPACTVLAWPAEHTLLAWDTTDCGVCPCTSFGSTPGTGHITCSCTDHCPSPSSDSSFRPALPTLLARHPVPASTATSANSSSDPCSSPGSNSSPSPSTCSYSYFQCPACTGLACAPWLSVPYNLNLTRGVYDKMMMTILGNVKPNAKMFTVNFLRGYDIAFHINPRFSEGGKQVLVRNHKLGERWGQEERDLKVPFPFALGSPFEMKILCTPEAFRVAVNNIPLFEFRHRVREINQIDRINILHDVVLTYINVETLP
uniref:Galectin n=1 Tax=Scophthalmus maximus TaxID=52904 RepID=A0A6B9VT03_SCOMX|nr:galectin 3bb [Scophthalmus maximus]